MGKSGSCLAEVGKLQPAAPPAFVREVFLEHSHSHSSLCEPWLLCLGGRAQ